MDRTKKRRSGQSQSDLTIHTEWATGPRTAAWDQLWRTILGRMHPTPSVDVHESRGPEVSNA